MLPRRTCASHMFVSSNEMHVSIDRLKNAVITALTVPTFSDTKYSSCFGKCAANFEAAV